MTSNGIDRNSVTGQKMFLVKPLIHLWVQNAGVLEVHMKGTRPGNQIQVYWLQGRCSNHWTMCCGLALMLACQLVWHSHVSFMKNLNYQSQNYQKLLPTLEMCLIPLHYLCCQNVTDQHLTRINRMLLE